MVSMGLGLRWIWVLRNVLLTFPADSFPEGFCVGYLVGIILTIVSYFRSNITGSNPREREQT